ncbi:MAG: SWIM zinc finger family protein [Actinobacteria bacterium]|nr:SWIM zinc finger family protein [Actinomycetota bacterium]MCL6105509.1 SWIM zinc finger family protein [Actinomycetota bacterium]
MSRYNRSYEWYPQPSRPKPADGLRARSQRGAIGETWWSKRFIDVLESFHMGTRLTRGRTYARAGQVLGVEVMSGEVASRVQGSRSKPYTVSIRLLPLSAKDWAKVEKAMEERAVFLAKLLAGEMPHDIEEVFSACQLSLFPESLRDLVTDCSCPDWSNPCKHIAATFYLLAETFDEDPFLVFQWRGRTKKELLSRLASRGGMQDYASYTTERVPFDGVKSCVSSGSPQTFRLAQGSEQYGESRDSNSLSMSGGGFAVTQEPPSTLWPMPLCGIPPPLDECIDTFYECAKDIDGVNFHNPEGMPHDTILNELDELPLELDGVLITDLLRPAYDAMAELVAGYVAKSTPG